MTRRSEVEIRRDAPPPPPPIRSVSVYDTTGDELLVTPGVGRCIELMCVKNGFLFEFNVATIRDLAAALNELATQIEGT